LHHNLTSKLALVPLSIDLHVPDTIFHLLFMTGFLPLTTHAIQTLNLHDENLQSVQMLATAKLFWVDIVVQDVKHPNKASSILLAIYSPRHGAASS
jgi:phosphoribosylpyrophosphate synthetase